MKAGRAKRVCSSKLPIDSLGKRRSHEGPPFCFWGGRWRETARGLKAEKKSLAQSPQREEESQARDNLAGKGVPRHNLRTRDEHLTSPYPLLNLRLVNRCLCIRRAVILLCVLPFLARAGDEWKPGFYPLLDEHAKPDARTAKLEAEVRTADGEIDFDGTKVDLGIGRYYDGARTRNSSDSMSWNFTLLPIAEQDSSSFDSRATSKQTRRRRASEVTSSGSVTNAYSFFAAILSASLFTRTCGQRNEPLRTN